MRKRSKFGKLFPASLWIFLISIQWEPALACCHGCRPKMHHRLLACAGMCWLTTRGQWQSPGIISVRALACVAGAASPPGVSSCHQESSLNAHCICFGAWAASHMPHSDLLLSFLFTYLSLCHRECSRCAFCICFWHLSMELFTLILSN